MPSKRISKDNIFQLIKELAKEYRKHNRHSPPIELIIVGGGSVLLNYNFRSTTTDIDMLCSADDAIQRAAAIISEEYGLADDWINTDFKQTASFSAELRAVSKHYCTLNNGTFEIRTVNAEYLIAMKIRAYRAYKHDRSDIIGIILDEKQSGNILTADQITSAYHRLYGKEEIPKDLVTSLRRYQNMTIDQLQAEFQKVSTQEVYVGTELQRIDQQYTGLVKENNVDQISKQVLEKHSELVAHNGPYVDLDTSLRNIHADKEAHQLNAISPEKEREQ